MAGTNGKGSVIAYLAAMLQAAGRTVHAYTSPQLVHFHERIVPRLREGGVSDGQIKTLLVDNPRRFFAGEPVRA